MSFQIHLENIMLILSIIVPYLFLFIFKPHKPWPKVEGLRYQIINLLIHLGQLAVFIVLLTSTITLKGMSKIVVIIGIFFIIAIYYLVWIHYIEKGRRIEVLYEPMLHIKTPLTLLPLIYLILCCLLIQSVIGILIVIGYGSLEVGLTRQFYYKIKKQDHAM